MRAALLTTLACTVAYAGWQLGGIAAELAGLDELAIPARLASVFLALTAAEAALARLSPAAA